MENELLDLLKKKQVDAQKESAMSLIAGGIGEALSGDTGGSVAQFGNQLAKDRLDRSDRFGEMGLKAQVAAKTKADQNDKKRYQQAAVQAPDGSIQLRTFDTTTGTYIDPEQGMLKGFSPSVRVDPTTGELARVTKSDADPTAQPIRSRGAEAAPFTIKQEKDVERAEDRLATSPLYKKAKESIAASTKIKSLLNSQNSVADSGVGTLFLRSFGEVGALSDRERQQFFGSPELARRFSRMWSKATDGLLTDADRQELLEVADTMETQSSRVLFTEIDNAASTASNRTGIEKGKISDVLSPSGRVPRTKAKNFKKEYVEQDGNVYVKERGEWKFLRKKQ